MEKKKPKKEVECNEKIKLVVVGNPNVGKTCMLITGCKEEGYGVDINDIPKTVDSVTIKGRKSAYSSPIYTCWDTSDCEGERIRKLHYPETDVFLICFSVVDESSYLAVEKFRMEIADYYSKCVIIVGTKIDLRKHNDTSEPQVGLGAFFTKLFSFKTKKKKKKIGDDGKEEKREITTREGRELAKKLKASAYIECNALDKKSVTILFNVVGSTLFEKLHPVSK